MFKFEWLVPARGFQWADRKPFPGLGKFMHKTKSERFLVAVDSPKPPRSYSLFDQRALFTTFGETTPTEDGVLTFANRYGFLGRPCSCRIAEPDPLKPDTWWPASGERFSDWIREIALMRHGVDLWTNVKRGPARTRAAQESLKKRLEPFIKWEKINVGTRSHPIEGRRVNYYGGEYFRSFVIADQRDRNRFAQLSDKELVRPAWLALLQIVTEQLKKFPLNGALEYTEPQEEWEENAARFVISNDSLLGAMWMQFAEAIAKNLELRRCAECGAPFSEDQKRADAKFCNTTCKMRYHYKRYKRENVKKERKTK